MNTILKATLVLVLVSIVLTACIKPAPEVEPWRLSLDTVQSSVTPSPIYKATIAETIAPLLKKPIGTPTPNESRVMPTLRPDPIDYVVQPNDSLSFIARSYGIDINSLMNENQIINPNYLEVGQQLVIPTADPNLEPSSFKIIPDSELVLSPSSIGFDVSKFLSNFSGYLSTLRFADEVVKQVAEDYSVNPRILLAAFEYQTGWLTSQNTGLDPTKPAPDDAWKTNVFQVLSGIADALNWGFYRWNENQIAYFITKDGAYIPASSVINGGTAAVQYWASTWMDRKQFARAVSEEGIYQLYIQYFGNPFQYSYEPLLPENLFAPNFTLPFQNGVVWSFTGGPHPSWGDGSAWGALDFAPPGSPMGCVVSGDWVTAIADGVIIRNEYGEVVQDLDGDGYEETGWVILYMHISSWQQVASGTMLQQGDLIGHASCEGGVSTGAHLHIARKYNGMWIDAEGDFPFVMDGYQAISSGIAYDGFLEKNGVYIEASAVYRPESLVAR